MGRRPLSIAPPATFAQPAPFGDPATIILIQIFLSSVKEKFFQARFHLYLVTTALAADEFRWALLVGARDTRREIAGIGAGVEPS